MMHYYGMGYGFMGAGWIFQLLILLLIIGVIWWLIKDNVKNTSYNNKDTAVDILKKRLARGEITEKEFRTLKRELE